MKYIYLCAPMNNIAVVTEEPYEQRHTDPQKLADSIISSYWSELSILEYRLDELSCESIGATHLQFLYSRKGVLGSVPVGHHRVPGPVIICRKVNGWYEGIKLRNNAIVHIIKFTLAISSAMGGDEPLKIDVPKDMENIIRSMKP